MHGSMKEMKVVVIGGGSGSSVALRGLKKYTSQLAATTDELGLILDSYLCTVV